MPGTSPGMTSFTTKPRFYWLLFQSGSQDEVRPLSSPRMRDLVKSVKCQDPFAKIF
jgi:hypothetical protein